MKNSDIFDLIMGRLGKRSSVSLRAWAVLEMQNKVAQLERGPTQPWFLEKLWQTSTVAGDPVLAVPTDFLCELEETALILTTSTGTKYVVRKRTYDVVLEQTSGSDPTIPSYYAIFGNSFVFGPTPKEAYAIVLPYGRKSVAFADNADNAVDWLAEATNPMIYSTLQAIANDYLQDPDMAGRYGQEGQNAWTVFNTYVEQRKYTNLFISNGEVDEP